MIDMLTSSLIAITIAPFFVLAWFLMLKAEAVADNLLGTAKSRVWTPVVFSSHELPCSFYPQFRSSNRWRLEFCHLYRSSS